MSRIIVIGGSVAGLGAALTLAREGHRVTVLERDATPMPETPVEAFESWERRGAPQVRHSHAFLARLRNLLRDEMPDVLASLLATGAEELRFSDLLPPTIDDRGGRPGDDDLVMLACRRMTFEWVLRRAALDQDGVEFRDGAEVRGLLADPSADPVRVTGVEFARAGETETLEADWVIDASGRRSPLSRWLEAAGGPAIREESEDCGIFYCSRFYRLLPGAPAPRRDTTIGADLGYLKYAIFHGDSKIFSITFAASHEDDAMRALLRLPAFEAAAAALPATQPWVDPAVAAPISDVHGMASLRNTRRYFVEEGRPIAQGLLAIGDAAIHTNPLYGRGCSFALVHAFLLAEALRDHPDDPIAAALALDAATVREIVPWYDLSLAQDRDARTVARLYESGADPTHAPESTGQTGDTVDPRAYMRSLLRHGLLPALRSDPDVSRAFFRSFNLLAAPGDVMSDPKILGVVLQHYQQRGERVEPTLGPNRAGMLDAFGDAH
ncbi:MAG: NAD-binding protein [Myxococcales bacterium]|nr:NAD-binding protein [Myxococcales bacterium]